MSDLLHGALIAGSAAICGAILGSFVTWWNTRESNKINRENALRSDSTVRESALRLDATTRALKLTDHRVAWLQKLRDEMSTFLSCGTEPFIANGSRRDLVESGTRILLLMNVGDPDFKKLNDLVRRLQPSLTLQEKRDSADEYIEVCQRILKREWEIAKKELRDGSGNADLIRFCRE